MKSLLNLVLYSLLTVGMSFPLFAAEKLGTMAVDEVLLRPSFKVAEGQDAEFNIGESSFSLSWFKTQDLGGVIRIGPESLINPMLHFQDDVSDRIAIVEAFAQVKGVYGRLRMGLIPIEFGIEGSWLESEMTFSRSYIFSNRWVPLRDYGLSYQVGNHGFYTRMAIHNGEGTNANKDGRMFFTASWGWSNYRNFNLGVSAFTGTTKPESTQNVTKDLLAGVDVNKEALWRMSNLYIHWHPNQWFFLAEFIFAELDQDSEVTKFNGGHVDLGYRWTPFLSSQLRYDHSDPNEKLPNDLQRKASLAIEVSDKHHTNSLFFIFSKIYEQGSNIHNDEAKIVWRLSPIYHPQL